MKYIIYCINNKVNFKKYIGSTTEKWVKWRKSNHFNQLKVGKHKNFKLQGAYNKYGEENLEWIILEVKEGSLEERNERETLWIKTLNSFKKGYNCTEDCKGSGQKLPNSQKSKLSETRKRLFKEGKLKAINLKGEKRDPILMAAINAKKRISICQYSLDNVYIRDWDSATTASKELKINKRGIYNCLSQKYKYAKTAGGFIWKYKFSERQNTSTSNQPLPAT